MFNRLIPLAPVVALLAAAAFSGPAQAGVSWSIGINAPIAPGVHVGTVLSGGRPHVGVGIMAPVYAPAPVVYAPAPVYMPPPVYAPAPVVYEEAPVYMPPPVYAPAVYAPAPYYYGHRHSVYYRPPVVRPPVYRPPVMARPMGGAVMGRPVYGEGRGGYGPVAQWRGDHGERGERSPR